MCVARPNQIKRRIEKKTVTKQPYMSEKSELINGFCVVPSSEVQSSSSQKLSDSWTKQSNTEYFSMVYKRKVHAWVLPLSISQSKYGGRKKPSSACTLITLQIAHDFLNLSLPIPYKQSTQSQPLPDFILDVMVNAIVDGNETHRREMAIRRHGIYNRLRKSCNEQSSCSSFLETMKAPLRDTFTIPEAIKVHQPELHEIDYRSYSGNFFENLYQALSMAVNSPLLITMPRLAFGILGFERAMSCLYDRSTHSICLIDTHMHFRGRAGGIILSSSFSNLRNFIVAVANLAFPEVFMGRERRGQFEISCLMLTELSPRIFKGQIFLTSRNLNSFKDYGNLKFQKTDLNQVSDDTDSGYESDEEDKGRSQRCHQ